MSAIAQPYLPGAVVIWELEAGYSIQCGHEAATATSWDLAVGRRSRF